jgi:Putative zinc-finger
MTEFGLPRGAEQLDDDRYVTWDAAYVLGSLSSDDRREFEAHLETCPRCRAAVAELSGIPALLAELESDDISAFDDGQHPDLRPQVLDSLLDTVRSQRTRRRWVTTAGLAAAAALLAIGLVIAIRPEILGLQTGTQQPTAAPALEMTKVSDTPINATISMTGYGWGTRIDMACTYGDWGRRDAPPQNLGMVVVGRDGSHTQIATWLGLSGATALPSANTPMPMQEIAAVQLVSPESGEVLLEKHL